MSVEPAVCGRVESDVRGRTELAVCGRVDPAVYGRVESAVCGRVDPAVYGRVESAVCGRVESAVCGRGGLAVWRDGFAFLEMALGRGRAGGGCAKRISLTWDTICDELG